MTSYVVLGGLKSTLIGVIGFLSVLESSGGWSNRVYRGYLVIANNGVYRGLIKRCRTFRRFLNHFSELRNE